MCDRASWAVVCATLLDCGVAMGLLVRVACMMLMCGRVVLCGVMSGSVRERSCKGGTRWYSLGPLRSGKGTGAALTGVGKTLADEYGVVRADSLLLLLLLLLSGLVTDALGRVEAVGLSSSVYKGRPWGGSILSGCPR